VRIEALAFLLSLAIAQKAAEIDHNMVEISAAELSDTDPTRKLCARGPHYYLPFWARKASCWLMKRE